MKLKSFVKLNLQTKIEVLRVFCLCGIARAVILLVPFNKFKKYLGTYNVETSYETAIEEYRIAKRVRWMVERTSQYTPWESKCLVQAMVAQYLMKRHNIHTTLYLGVAKDREESIKAHAWLRCGQLIVTGAAPMPEYTVVAKFAN